MQDSLTCSPCRPCVKQLSSVWSESSPHTVASPRLPSRRAASLWSSPTGRQSSPLPCTSASWATESPHDVTTEATRGWRRRESRSVRDHDADGSTSSVGGKGRGEWEDHDDSSDKDGGNSHTVGVPDWARPAEGT